MKSKKKGLCIILAVALVFSVLIELCLFTVNRSIEFGDGSTSLLSKEGCTLTAANYNINGNKYGQNDVDPQLNFSGVNEDVKTVYIKFGSHIIKDTPVQIYYAEKDMDFTPDNSKHTTVSFPSKSLIMEIPEGDYASLRIDIDGDFALEDVIVSSSSAKTVTHFDGSFNVLHVLIFFAAISIALFITVKWATSEKSVKSLTTFEFIFLVGCFIFYSLWTLKRYNYAPDEAMRYDVSLFFFENNRLPIGHEVANPIWGFSYALLPTMLCNVLDYIPMKLASLFTSSDYIILLAARMVSVCCATGVVYYIIKASKQIFTSYVRWIMIILVAGMPQFAFLASYVNNDICALLGVSMILYAWTLAINENWNFKNALLLSVGMATCATSYYNSYMWILASIFIYFITYFYQNKKDYKGFVKLSSFIVIVTLLLMGYLFARHVYLYNDLIGMKVSREHGEMYGLEAYKPSNRETPYRQGYSLMDMLIGMEWITITYKSFIGMFGYMAHQLNYHIYKFYALFFVIAFIGIVIRLFRIFANLKHEKVTLQQTVFTLALIACGVVTVCLSVYNSYCSDFQPQGRYCYPMLPALAIFTARGFETLLGFIKNEKARIASVSAICTVIVAISINSYYSVLLLT